MIQSFGHSDSSRERYRSINGPTYAFRNVVVVRSYSRNSGTDLVGAADIRATAPAIASRTTRSFSGFAYECRKQIAIDSTFAFANLSRQVFEIAGAAAIVPSKYVRSFTPKHNVGSASTLLRRRTQDIQVLAVLTPDLDDIFEPSGCHRARCGRPFAPAARW